LIAGVADLYTLTEKTIAIRSLEGWETRFHGVAAGFHRPIPDQQTFDG
jgi:hypothetical protein